MNYCAWVFFVNGEDLLCRAIRSMEYAKDRLTVIDNSEYGLKSVPFGRIYRPPIPLTFAQSQNLILKESLRKNCDFYLWFHHDAQAIGDTCEQMVKFVSSLEQSDKKWGVCFSAYDAFAAFNTTAFRAIGGWDTFIAWYCSDVDCYRRLRLAGYECIDTGLPVNHVPSQTLNSDPDLCFRNSITFPLYLQYYAQKWGGSPGNEIYTDPFNRRMAL